MRTGAGWQGPLHARAAVRWCTVAAATRAAGCAAPRVGGPPSARPGGGGRCHGCGAATARRLEERVRYRRVGLAGAVGPGGALDAPPLPWPAAGGGGQGLPTPAAGPPNAAVNSNPSQGVASRRRRPSRRAAARGGVPRSRGTHTAAVFPPPRCRRHRSAWATHVGKAMSSRDARRLFAVPPPPRAAHCLSWQVATGDAAGRSPPSSQ